MRFSDYRKIKNLIISIKEALDYMEICNDNSLLHDCILALDGITTFLTNNSTSLKTKNLLSEAENLIHCFQKAITNGHDRITLYETLESFEQQCEQNIKRKYKLLFVADIRGKWDSMSSVYEAAKKRDDCDIDVIIQPVFRTVELPNKEKRNEILYEDYLTDRGISHTLYKNYKIEEELPDITFISQPYESCTLPMFWPENIAKYSKLVYLPYFTATALNARYFTEMHAFFYMDVEKHAWKIACQSSKMAAYYKTFASQRGQNTIVSGLPKWDEVISPNSKLIQCPKEWEKKLAGKKVILWNTHYTIDGHASGILEKGSAFINMVKEMEGIALIWRPHPLTEMIIKAYIPERYTEYLALIKSVISSDNMVLDTSASYVTAFYCSDALITDLSSITIQYLFMNKPILMLVKDSIEAGRKEFYTIDGLFDYLKLPFASTLEEQKAFIEAVRCGKNVNETERTHLRETYFPLADGKCGERFINQVLDDYIEEVIFPKEPEYYGNGKILIVGPLQDSLPCIEQFKRNGNSFCICSDFIQTKKHHDYNIVSLHEITKSAYELIVITAREDATQIRDFLINYYGINKDRTLLFWQTYKAKLPLMLCDRIMQNPKNKHIDGIIIGLSHSETGLLPERLPGTFCNLSVSSQDLYYQFKTIEYCSKKYYDQIKNLKYMIIDLCDYNYFNYDTSRSTNAINYMTWGGFHLDPHNFRLNTLANAPFNQFIDQVYLNKAKNVTENELIIWDQIFPEIYECADYEGFCVNFQLDKRTKIVSTQEINNYSYNRAPSTKIFKETITENANTLRRMLQLLHRINPEMKIYTIIIPKYLEVEALDARGLMIHEPYFNSIIDNLQKEYNFTHLDFKKLSDISSHKQLYFDAAHLNYFGAIQFTDELRKHIFN